MVGMTGKSRWRAAVAVAAAAVTALAGCSSSGKSSGGGGGGNKSPYKLGFSLTLSGPESSYGVRAQEGATVAINKINAAGGVNGHPLKAYYVDNQFPNTSVALASLQKLISLDHVLSVTASGSSLLLAYQPVTVRAHTLLLNYAATDPTIANPDKLTYSLIASAPEEANSLVSYLKSKGQLGSAAVIADDSAVGKAADSAFEAAWKGAGGTITSLQTYEVNSLDLSGQVAKVAAQKPKFVYFQISTPTEAAAILKAGNQLNFHPQWLSNTFFGATNSAPVVGSSGNGLLYSYVAFQPGNNPLATTYATTFKAKYNKDPDIYTATAEVSVELMAAALKAVGTDPNKIASYLNGLTNFASILGNLSFNHGQLEMPVDIEQVTNGQVQKVSGS